MKEEVWWQNVTGWYDRRRERKRKDIWCWIPFHVAHRFLLLLTISVPIPLPRVRAFFSLSHGSSTRQSSCRLRLPHQAPSYWRQRFVIPPISFASSFLDSTLCYNSVAVFSHISITFYSQLYAVVFHHWKPLFRSVIASFPSELELVFCGDSFK